MCGPLLDAVMHGFEKRLKPIMDLESREAMPALIATVCHPHFKLRWIAPDKKTPEAIERIVNVVVRAADEISKENWNILLESKQHTDSFSAFAQQNNHAFEFVDTAQGTQLE